MNDLARVERAPVLTRDQVVDNRALVRRIMEGVMQPGIHYGVIPGTGKKPSLLKPGAEVLLSTFRIATTLKVEDLGGDDLVHYRVIVSGTHGPTGIPLGEGLGECSSNEKKYKWRRPTCESEFKDFEPRRRRLVWIWNSDRGAEEQLPQVRVDPADVANTILKMAKKRALVDFCLTALAVSDLFSQDAEDLEKELQAAVAEDEQPAGNGNAGTGQQGGRRGGGKAGGKKPDTKAPQATGANSGGAAAAAGTQGATVPVAEFLREIDSIGIREIDFLNKFNINDVAKLPLNKVEEARAWLKQQRTAMERLP